jgi:hypothetical protein
MEHAILEEAAHPEHAAIGVAAHQTETLLDGPAWEQATSARAPAGSPRLRIESVGAAAAAGDGSVRIELTFADDEGRRSSAVLSLRLDDLIEEASR